MKKTKNVVRVVRENSAIIPPVWHDFPFFTKLLVPAFYDLLQHTCSLLGNFIREIFIVVSFSCHIFSLFHGDQQRVIGIHCISYQQRNLVM